MFHDFPREVLPFVTLGNEAHYVTTRRPNPIDAKAQAVAEWRTAHEGFDHVTNEVILTLTSVQWRAFRITLSELGRTITRRNR